MKTYIFIIRRICNITGAQQYVYNKTRYLKSQGWRVLIFSSLRGKILIEDFKEYEDLIFPSLYLSPYYYRKSEVYMTLNSIINVIGDCKRSDCIVESDSFSRSVWGELIASRLKCRNLTLLVQEKHKLDEDGKSFLMFKYTRHELAGISRKSLSQIFEDESVLDRKDTRFGAYCNNVFEECTDKYSILLNKNADYTLGSLGRLSKSCVPPIIDGIYSYVNHHLDKKFNVVLVGGPINHINAKFARKKLGSCKNVNLVMTGDMYPIPVSFIRKVDVFISTAGSATGTYQAGIPTLKVNPLNGDPVGVMGLGEKMISRSMYDSRSDLSIEFFIEKAITHRTEIIYSRVIGEDYYKKMHEEFERQLSFSKTAITDEYYDENKLMHLKSNSRFPNTLLWLLGHISGRFLTYVMQIKNF